MVRVDYHYNNISNYNPLPGSSQMKLIRELGNLKKGTINLTIKDNESFHWYPIGHLNLMNKHQQQIKQSDIEMVENRDCKSTELAVSKRNIRRFKQNIILVLKYLNINMTIKKRIKFIYQRKILKIIQNYCYYKKSSFHYVCAKDFNRFNNELKHKEKKNIFV